jgi:hypothetical protein
MTTITEGLADLKTLRKRIDKKRESLGPYLARAEAIRDPLEKQGGSASHIKAEIQAVADLEAQYLDIRRRIAAANDATQITVSGVTKSIAQWLIWRREIAPSYQQLEHIEEVLGTLDGQLSLKNATTEI